MLEAIGQKDHWVGVMCRAMLGMALHYSNQLTLGYACFQEAMEAQQTLENPYIRAFVLAPFGQFYLSFGYYEEAERLAHESNHILALLNNQFLRPFNLSTLGRVAMVRGRYKAAEAYHQEALTMRVNMDSRSGIAYTWSDLADVTLLQGKFDEAQHYLQQILTFEQEHHMGFGVDATNLRLGRLAAAQGNYQLAKQYLAKMKGRVLSQQWTESGVGWAYLETQDIETARQIFLADLQTMKTANRPPAALDVIAGLAHLKALDGLLSRALELIALVLNHPAATQMSKEQVVALKEELTAELSADVVLAAEVRGRELDLWETAVSLLAEKDDE